MKNLPVAANNLRALLAVLLAGCLLSPLAAQQEDAAQQENNVLAVNTAAVKLVDGGAVVAQVNSIAEDGTVQLGAKTVALDNIRRIVKGAGEVDRDASAVVQLLGGSQVFVRQVTIDTDQVCHFENQIVGKLKFPIDLVRAIRFNTDTQLKPGFAQALTEREDEDRLLVKLGDDLEPLSGLIETLDAGEAAFDFSGELRKLPREKLYGIVLALVSRPPDHMGHCLITLADGSTLWGKVARLQDGKLHLQPSEDVELAIPWESVARVDVRSSRMVFLSDLEPVDAEHQPLVTLKRNWQRDKSVDGRQLKLDGIEYEKGIGVASRSVLTFESGGRWDLLAATIGIDDETNRHGHCVFVVEGDGRELGRWPARGGVKQGEPGGPQSIQVDITGIDRVTLIVEPGEDLDLADHADWCEVRLVKQTKER